MSGTAYQALAYAAPIIAFSAADHSFPFIDQSIIRWRTIRITIRRHFRPARTVHIQAGSCQPVASVRRMAVHRQVSRCTARARCWARARRTDTRRCMRSSRLLCHHRRSSRFCHHRHRYNHHRCSLHLRPCHPRHQASARRRRHRRLPRPRQPALSRPLLVAACPT